MHRHSRFKRFVHDAVIQTPLLRMILLLVVLWLAFSAGLYAAERGVAGTAITSFGRALYWGIAAFSTAGIAEVPVSGCSAAASRRRGRSAAIPGSPPRACACRAASPATSR